MRSRLRWALCLAVLPVLVSGCILLEPARWRDLTGPSWDVPITIPFLPRVRFDLSGLEYIANQDNEIGFHYPVESFVPAELTFSEAGRISLPPTVLSAGDGVEVSLAGLADFPEFQMMAAELTVAIENSPRIEGQLNLRVEAIREAAVVASVEALQGLADDVPFTIDLAPLLNTTPRPDGVRLHYGVDLPAQSVDVEPGDRVAVHAELWVPLYVHMPSEPLRIEAEEAIQLHLDDDAKATLSDARLADLAFIVDVVNHMPVGMGIELLFSNNPESAEEALVFPFAVPNGELDATGRVAAPAEVSLELQVTEALRQLLVGDQAYVTPRFTLYNDQVGPDGVRIRFASDDHVALRGYAVVTIGVNRSHE